MLVSACWCLPLHAGLASSVLRTCALLSAPPEPLPPHLLHPQIGPGDFTPPDSTWSIADCGHNWGVWFSSSAEPAGSAVSPQ